MPPVLPRPRLGDVLEAHHRRPGLRPAQSSVGFQIANPHDDLPTNRTQYSRSGATTGATPGAPNARDRKPRPFSPAPGAPGRRSADGAPCEAPDPTRADASSGVVGSWRARRPPLSDVALRRFDGVGPLARRPFLFQTWRRCGGLRTPRRQPSRHVPGQVDLARRGRDAPLEPRPVGRPTDGRRSMSSSRRGMHRISRDGWPLAPRSSNVPPRCSMVARADISAS